MEYFSNILDKSGKVAVDDLILVKGVECNAGSKILEGFKSLFSAEVVERLENAGCKLAGTTPVGEFGLDLVGEFSYGKNQSGRLYGAAAELVARKGVEFALGVDMNGSCRRAAALSGVKFLKPTYGTVSRYGIISCAASGEQIGVYADKASTIAEAMGVIAGHDSKDGTSLPTEKYAFSADEKVAGKRVALFENLFDRASEGVKKSIDEAVKALEAKGVTVERISFEYSDLANVSWWILMSAETCNNISRYDGVKFGFRAEKYKDIDKLYVNTRTEGFNFLTKSVVLYGSDALSKKRYKECYEKSLKARRLIVDELNKLFERFDAVMLPTCGSGEYESYDIKDAFLKTYGESVYTAAASITGMPALACGTVQLMGKAFAENTLLSLAEAMEQEDK